MPAEELGLSITDPNNITESFATSVIQVGLISGSSVAVTLGVRRYLQPNFGSEPKETVCISSRLILTMDAAQNLAEAVSAMLSGGNKESSLAVPETPKPNPGKSH